MKVGNITRIKVGKIREGGKIVRMLSIVFAIRQELTDKRKERIEKNN